MSKKRTAPNRIKTGSAFLDWFQEQAGKPLMNEAQHLKLRHSTLPALLAQLARYEARLAEMERYNTAKQYALYAWQASQNDRN